MTTLKSYIAKLKTVSKALASDDRILQRIAIVSMNTVSAEFLDRIFVLGRAADGTAIGAYSTKPYYVNPARLVGLPKSGVAPKGKTGKRRFKDGRPHKTRYLGDGYKEFRGLVGRQNSKVDLNLTGASFLSIQVGIKDGAVVLGFTDGERRDILLGNEKRFGNEIFTLSAAEKQLLFDVASEEIVNIVQEILR